MQCQRNLFALHHKQVIWHYRVFNKYKLLKNFSRKKVKSIKENELKN